MDRAGVLRRELLGLRQEHRRAQALREDLRTVEGAISKALDLTIELGATDEELAAALGTVPQAIAQMRRRRSSR